MQKSQDSGNRPENTSFSSSETEHHVLDRKRSRRSRAAGAVAGLALGLTMGASGPAIAQTSTSLDDVHREAIRIESKLDYQQDNPADNHTGLDSAEDRKVHKFLGKYPTVPNAERVVYYLSRHAPLKVYAYQGRTLYDHLVQWVTGNNRTWFPPLPFFANATPKQQQNVLAAMLSTIHKEGVKNNYLSKVQSTGKMKLPKGKKILEAGLQAMLSYTPAASQPQVKAPVPPAPQPQPTPQPTIPQMPVAPQPTAAQSPVNPCDDPQFRQSLDAIAKPAKDKMDDDSSLKDVKKAAEGTAAKYNALAVRCPHKGTLITAEAKSLENAIAEYEKDGKESARFTRLNLGGGAWVGDPLRETGYGLLNLGWATPKTAKNPFAFGVFAVGGNYSSGATDNFQSTDRPFTDLMLEFGGKVDKKPYHIRLTWSGLWLAQQMNPWTVPEVTGQPVKKDIAGGTEITTETTSSSGSSGSDGSHLQNWLFSAEAGLYLSKNFMLTLGAAYGQSFERTVDESRSDSSTITVHDSVDQGPPKVETHSETTVKVGSDTKTVSDVNTDHIGGRLGMLVKPNRKVSFGLDVSFFYSGIKTSGKLTTGEDINVGDTVTDVTVDGIPPIHDVTKGAHTPAAPKTEDLPDTESYTANVSPQLHVLYEGTQFVGRFQAGPAIAWQKSDGDAELDWPAIPVSGNATALYHPNNHAVLGLNALAYSNNFDLDFVWAMGKKVGFSRLVSHIDLQNDMLTRSLASDRLTRRFVDNEAHNFLETQQGFFLNGGLRLNHEKEPAGHGFLGYMHQFSSGPFGISVSGYSADRQVAGTLYVPLTSGLNLRLTGGTRKDDISGAQALDVMGTIVYHRRNSRNR